MITNKYVNDFIKCLDEERFYDAHEVLEDAWYPKRFEKSAEVLLLKGFINASVSFELMKQGKIEPSKQVWKTYLKYRQLLFKTSSKEIQAYYQIFLHIESTKKKLLYNNFKAINYK